MNGIGIYLNHIHKLSRYANIKEETVFERLHFLVLHAVGKARKCPLAERE